jgi:hypothetical protein
MTADVCKDVADTDPMVFVAVSVTRSVAPTSVG